MPVEIERIFLVADDSWRDQVTRSEWLRNGLLDYPRGGKVRIRVGDGRASLTIKSKRIGSKRPEFEYEIPVGDAEELLAAHCAGNVLSKTRRYIDYGGFVWEVDVYDAPLSGIILAEVETDCVDTQVPSPPWLGREVTNDPAFSKVYLRKQAIRRIRARR